MSEDRLSWREIDKLRDRPGGRRRKEKKEGVPDNATRYQRYRAELDRLFDQGLTDEILRKLGKPSAPDTGSEEKKAAPPPARQMRGRTARPDSSRQAKNRLKIMRQVIDAETGEQVQEAIDALVEKFGLPDEWEVLARLPEHNNEALVLEAVEKMLQLLPKTSNVPRRASLKQRLRITSQTAKNLKLRQEAGKLSALL